MTLRSPPAHWLGLLSAEGCGPPAPQPLLPLPKEWQALCPFPASAEFTEEKRREFAFISWNPARYRSRTEPLVTDPLGEPPGWLSDTEAEAWSELDVRLPWLNRSHRAIVEIASILQGRFRAGSLGVPGLQLLRVVLGQLGATPATAHHGTMPEAPSDDPADRYFA